MQHTIEKVAGVDKIFGTNHRRGSDFELTIQNQTGTALGLTYTNQRIQFDSPLVFVPAAGEPTTVATGAIVTVISPVTGIELAGTSTGDVFITEAG